MLSVAWHAAAAALVVVGWRCGGSRTLRVAGQVAGRTRLGLMWISWSQHGQWCMVVLALARVQAQNTAREMPGMQRHHHPCGFCGEIGGLWSWRSENGWGQGLNMMQQFTLLLLDSTFHLRSLSLSLPPLPLPLRQHTTGHNNSRLVSSSMPSTASPPVSPEEASAAEHGGSRAGSREGTPESLASEQTAVTNITTDTTTTTNTSGSSDRESSKQSPQNQDSASEFAATPTTHSSQQLLCDEEGIYDDADSVTSRNTPGKQQGAQPSSSSLRHREQQQQKRLGGPSSASVQKQQLGKPSSLHHQRAPSPVRTLLHHIIKNDHIIKNETTELQESPQEQQPNVTDLPIPTPPTTASSPSPSAGSAETSSSDEQPAVLGSPTPEPHTPSLEREVEEDWACLAPPSQPREGDNSVGVLYDSCMELHHNIPEDKPGATADGEFSTGGMRSGRLTQGLGVTHGHGHGAQGLGLPLPKP